MACFFLKLRGESCGVSRIDLKPGAVGWSCAFLLVKKLFNAEFVIRVFITTDYNSNKRYISFRKYILGWLMRQLLQLLRLCGPTHRTPTTLNRKQFLRLVDKLLRTDLPILLLYNKVLHSRILLNIQISFFKVLIILSSDHSLSLSFGVGAALLY